MRTEHTSALGILGAGMEFGASTWGVERSRMAVQPPTSEPPVSTGESFFLGGSDSTGRMLLDPGSLFHAMRVGFPHANA